MFDHRFFGEASFYTIHYQVQITVLHCGLL